MAEDNDFNYILDDPEAARLPPAFTHPVSTQPGDTFGLPPQCLHDVAAEIDELPTIAKRWDIPLQRLNQLLSTPSIKLQVEQKRAEMKASGVTFRMKAEVLAEDIMLEAYHAAKDAEASNAFKLETAKWLTKIADREPKQNTMAPGTGFSLQINIPSQTPNGQTQTIDITATPPPAPTTHDLIPTSPPMEGEYEVEVPAWLPKADEDTTL